MKTFLFDIVKGMKTQIRNSEGNSTLSLRVGGVGAEGNQGVLTINKQCTRPNITPIISIKATSIPFF